MKKLKVITSSKEVVRTITEIKYSYEFVYPTDGTKISGTNIGSENDLEKEIRVKTRRLAKDYDVEIVKAN